MYGITRNGGSTTPLYDNFPNWIFTIKKRKSKVRVQFKDFANSRVSIIPRCENLVMHSKVHIKMTTSQKYGLHQKLSGGNKFLLTGDGSFSMKSKGLKTKDYHTFDKKELQIKDPIVAQNKTIEQVKQLVEEAKKINELIDKANRQADNDYRFKDSYDSDFYKPPKPQPVQKVIDPKILDEEQWIIYRDYLLFEANKEKDKAYGFAYHCASRYCPKRRCYVNDLDEKIDEPKRPTFTHNSTQRNCNYQKRIDKRENIVSNSHHQQQIIKNQIKSSNKTKHNFTKMFDEYYVDPKYNCVFVRKVVKVENLTMNEQLKSRYHREQNE